MPILQAWLLMMSRFSFYFVLSMFLPCIHSVLIEDDRRSLISIVSLLCCSTSLLCQYSVSNGKDMFESESINVTSVYTNNSSSITNHGSSKSLSCAFPCSYLAYTLFSSSWNDIFWTECTPDCFVKEIFWINLCFSFTWPRFAARARLSEILIIAAAITSPLILKFHRHYYVLNAFFMMISIFTVWFLKTTLFWTEFQHTRNSLISMQILYGLLLSRNHNLRVARHIFWPWNFIFF